MGVGTREKVVFSFEAQGVNGQLRYVTVEPGKVQGRDRMGVVEGSCGYRAHGVSIRVKFVSLRNLGYKSRWSPCGKK